MSLAASEIKQVEEQVRALYYASMLRTSSEMNFEMSFTISRNWSWLILNIT